jgi:NADH-quinone oxidoreductase subunit N
MIDIIKPILPEMILFFGACLVLLLDAFQKLSNSLLSIASFVLVLSIVMMIFGMPDGQYYHDLFTISMFTKVIKVALTSLGLFQFLAASSLMNKYDMSANEHNVIVMFLMVGACIMVSSNHLMLLYLGMEIQALAVYTLVVMQRKSEFSAEAGVKYFILGSLSSVLYLFGVSYVYGAFGTLYFHEISIHEYVASTSGVLGSILIISAFLFKVGVFPFHQWVPDVYQGAPTPSTSIISTLSKIAAVAVLIKLITVFLQADSDIDFRLMLGVIAIFSMIVGATVPIVQTHMKRFLGYSSIGHAGFMLMAVVNISMVGLSAVIAYILVYGLTLIMILVCLMSLKDKRKLVEDCNDLSLLQLAGLAQVRPKHAFILAVGFLSMAGMPPLIGFFPKLLILQHVISSGNIILMCFAVLTTVISLFYYLKVIKLMYIDMPIKESTRVSTHINKKLLWVFAPVVAIQLLGCYVPVLQAVYMQYIKPAAETLIMENNEKDHS